MSTKIKPSNLDFTTLNIAVSNTGNVGIGTASPAEEFHLQATAPTLRLQDSDDNAYTNMVHNAGGFRIDVDPTAAGASSFFRVDVDALERMRITSTGNVGIGTSSPAQKLHLEQNTAATPIQLRVENNSATSGANAELYLVTEGNNLGIVTYPDADTPNANRIDFGSTAGSSYFTFSPNGSERMRIDSSGNVGVGTSPSVRFHASVSNATVVGRFESTSATNSSTIDFPNPANAINQIRIGSFGGDLSFLTAATERMRITSTGSVGIGTGFGTTPTDLLQVVGGNILIGTDSGDPFNTQARVRIQGAGSEYIQIKGDSTGTLGLLFGDATDNFLAGVLSNQPDNNLRFQAGNDERMRIEASGNVGIGTTAPTAKLHVTGDCAITGELVVDQGITTSTNDIYIGSDNGNIAGNSQIRFRTDGVNRMILNGDDVYISDNLYIGRLRDVATDSYLSGEQFIVIYGDSGEGRTIIRSPSGTDPDKTMFICNSDVTTYRGTGYVAGTYNDVFRVDQSGGIQGTYHWAGRTENDSSSPVSTFFVGEVGFQAYAYSGTTVTTTDPSTGASGGQAYVIARHTADSSPVFYSTVAGTVRFQSLANGTLNYSGTLAQLSDATFKTDITPANRQWDDIKALNIVNFRWADPNEDQKLRIGVIAQEVEAAGMPGLVDESYHQNPEYDGRKDPPEKKWLYLEDGVTKKSHKTVKTDVMLYKTIKALQEAMTRIEELETQVAALRSGNP